MRHEFKPTPAPITMAMWQMLGRLTMPTRPTSGLHWGVYVASGGPMRHSGKRG